MNFGILAVIVLAGLGGPLLGLLDRHFVPVVVGEILAGILVGPAVLGIVDPHQPTVSFLSEVGFAMLMLTVGMHLPLRDKRLAAALRGGAVLAALVGVLAVPAGLLAGEISGGGHAAIFAVVIASGSAAVLLPAIQESGLGGTEVLTVMAQVTIADVVTIVSVPIVLQPSRTWHTVLGTLLVAGAVVGLRLAALPLRGRAWVERVRHMSKERHWALDLRLSLLVAVRARVARAEGRDERPDRRLRGGRDGGPDRRPETALDPGAGQSPTGSSCPCSSSCWAPSSTSAACSANPPWSAWRRRSWV